MRFAGLLFCIALAAISIVVADLAVVRENLHLGALLIVIVIGMAWRSFWPVPAVFDEGIKFAQKPLLRAAVAGLGFRLSLQEIYDTGYEPLVIVSVSTLLSLVLGYWIARRLGLTEKLAMLLSVGTSICGASAIVAADSVLEAEKAEPAYALGIITLLGTLGIVLYPALMVPFGLNDWTYGIWNGASLHEMAQVVAAGDAVSVQAQVIATTVKLERILLLAPIVFGLAWWVKQGSRKNSQTNTPLAPWFLVLFVAFAAINSTGWLSSEIITFLVEVDKWLLCIGMAGVGLQAGFRELRGAGWRPVLAGFAQWILLAAITLGLTKWLI